MILNEVSCDYHVLECNIYTPRFAIRLSDKCTTYQVSKKTRVGGGFNDLTPVYRGKLAAPQELFDKALSNLISDEKLVSPLNTDLLFMSLKMLLFDSDDPGGDRLIKKIYENFQVENNSCICWDKQKKL